MAKAKKTAAKKAAEKNAKTRPAGDDRPARAEQSRPARGDQRSRPVGEDSQPPEAPPSTKTLHAVETDPDGNVSLRFQTPEGRPAVVHPTHEKAEVEINGQEALLGLEDLRRGDVIEVPDEADPKKPLKKVKATRRG